MVKKAPKKVPESVRKLEERKARSTEQAEKVKAEREQRRNDLRTDCANKAERFLAGYVREEAKEQKKKEEAKENGSFWVPDEPKVILAIRIRGINHMAPKPRKVLQLFRLIQLNSAVLIKSTKPAMAMLRMIEPYIAYGYPNWQTVSKLVYKRGYAKVNKQRIPITDNLVISENLGKMGIDTIEDLVHELVECGPNFKTANNFLWRFKLSSPKGGFCSKKKSYIQGGDWGNREEKINKLVRSML